MKIGILSQSDYGGGAFIAANRLHRGLIQAGLDSTMLVGKKETDDPTVLSSNSRVKKICYNIAMAVESLPLKYYSNRQGSLFSLQWVPEFNYSQINALDVDIFNLHWINLNFITIENIARLNKPIIWTIHDMWSFTGGCHYSNNCDRYINSCGSCPHLKSHKNNDLSHWVWQRKAKAWKNLNLTLVTPSKWLAECVSSSSLFKEKRVKVIPNGIDTKNYKPFLQRDEGRKLLNLPLDKKLVMFGANGGTKDQRKGFHLLLAALQSLINQGWQDKIELVIFGSSESINLPNLDIRIHYLGRLHDYISMVMAYSLADVMIVPSTQESFGQTASESLACGTPVVAFNATGLKDIVDHQQTGYLAEPYQTEDLAKGIAWVLSDSERHHKLRANAREKAEREFNLQLQANRYLSLFEEILE